MPVGPDTSRLSLYLKGCPCHASPILPCCTSCQELDLEGSNEEAARQLCALMTTLADFHWAHVDSVQKQHQILRHVSEALRLCIVLAGVRACVLMTLPVARSQMTGRCPYWWLVVVLSGHRMPRNRLLLGNWKGWHFCLPQHLNTPSVSYTITTLIPYQTG